MSEWIYVNKTQCMKKKKRSKNEKIGKKRVREKNGN